MKPCTLTVNVTARDIKTGQRLHCSECPIALAVRRAATLKFRKTCFVTVMGVVCVDRLRGRMSIKLGAFIYRFDNGLAVKPFKFKVKLT